MGGVWSTKGSPRWLVSIIFLIIPHARGRERGSSLTYNSLSICEVPDSQGPGRIETRAELHGALSSEERNIEQTSMKHP